MNFFTRAFSGASQESEQEAQSKPDKTEPVPTPQNNTESNPDVVKNPLDMYKALYENAGKDTEPVAPSFKLDPEILNKVSSSMDFTKGVEEDLLNKALSGDSKALLSVMQHVGRNAYSASLEHATALTDTHLSQRQEYDTKRLNEGVRSRLTEEALTSAPNYSHPVLKAELNRIASMIARQNPDASPSQIAKQAQEHLNNLSDALKRDTTPASAKREKEIDWTKYLTS